MEEGRRNLFSIEYQIRLTSTAILLVFVWIGLQELYNIELNAMKDFPMVDNINMNRFV